jgi:ubiquinone/menaquinone biosynthesis C-methylase UbiE
MRLANITSVYRSRLIFTTYRKWLKKDQSIVDVGCGTGVILRELQKLTGFESAIGCDIENYLIAGIMFKKMSSKKKLPFKSGQFDVAMLNDVLHHMPYENQGLILKDSLRVANEVVIFELKPTVIGKLSDYLINKIHNPRMNIPFTYRTVESWQKLFQKLGVKFKKRDVKTPLWYPFRHVAFRITNYKT